MKVQVAKKLKFLFEPHRYKVAYGGRGGSKSRAFATALVIASRKGPERILCCREIQNSIKDSVKKIIEDEIKRLMWEHDYHITRDSIICKSTGSPFIFAGLKNNVDSIKSMEGITKCWSEEAHTLSQNSLDVLEPTIRAEGSELWFSYNPKFETDPVHRMFVIDEPPPDAVVVKINYNDNPWFPDVLRTKLEWDRKKDHDKYLHVWEGCCVQFSDEQVMHGVWKIAETPEPPPGTILRYGLDFGFGTDPTAASRFWISGNTLYIDYEVQGHGVDIDDTPALLDKLPGVRQWPIKADSARPDSISYLNKHDFRVIGAKKGPNSIEDGISRLRGYNIVINPRCKYVIEEFTKYSYKRDKQTDEILPVIVDKWNHFIDGLRYGTEGMDANSTFLDFEVIAKAIAAEREIPFGTPKLFGIYQNALCRRHGRKVEEIHRTTSTDPIEVAAWVAGLINDYKPDAIMINEDGIGAGIVDRLKLLGYRILPVNSFANAEDERQWPDKITEMWDRLKEWLPGADIPDDEWLKSDLLTQTFTYDTKKRVKIEKDREIKDWPSCGDALATTFAYPTPPVTTHQQADLEPEWAEDM